MKNTWVLGRTNEGDIIRCVCLPGYEEVGGRCQDIDECNDRMVCGTDSECQVGNEDIHNSFMFHGMS